MNEASNISSHGYQPLRELGHNSLGGRVTYLAEHRQTREQVVVKQFQFATGNSTWSEYDSYQQEIKVLKSLDHPGIPRYLDSFQTPGGFCMVQEYIDAPSAATRRSWTPEQIKAIALSTLEILVYLQSRHPSIIHRDIKPENILIDDKLNVYLVDFGFARLGGGDIAASSVVKGTMGFMPPEQLFNRRLTNASDLYALGATLICLLTGIKSVDIGSLIDSDYRIHFRHLIPPQKRGWLNWLERMVEPKVGNRFANAADALSALEPLNVSRLPRVRLEHKTLTFKAEEWGEKVSQAIAITNPVPDTVLSGRWEVAPHPSDPPHTPYDHPYISFTPQKFEVNQLTCTVTVDTRQLLIGETYKRQIVLRTNSDPETYTVNVSIKTAPVHPLKSFLSFSLIRIFLMVLLVKFGFMIFNSTPELFVGLNNGYNDLLMSLIFMLFGAFFAEEKMYEYGFQDLEKKDIKNYRFREIFKIICGGFVGFGFTSIVIAIGWIVISQVYTVDDLGLILFLGSLAGAYITINLFPKDLPLYFLILVCLSIGMLFHIAISKAIGRIDVVLVSFFMLILILIFAHALIYFLSCLLDAIAKMFLFPDRKHPVKSKDYRTKVIISILFCLSLGAILRFVANGLGLFAHATSTDAIALYLTLSFPLFALLIPLLNSILFQPVKTLRQYRKLQPTLIKP